MLFINELLHQLAAAAAGGGGGGGGGDGVLCLKLKPHRGYEATFWTADLPAELDQVEILPEVSSTGRPPNFCVFPWLWTPLCLQAQQRLAPAFKWRLGGD
jgi:hypothetical protein